MLILDITGGPELQILEISDKSSYLVPNAGRPRLLFFCDPFHVLELSSFMHFIIWLRSHFDSFPGSCLDPATTLLPPFTHFYGQEEVCIYAQYFS